MADDEPMRGRLVRVSDDDWKNFKEAAAARGETPSAAIRAFIKRYNARWRRKAR